MSDEKKVRTPEEQAAIDARMAAARAARTCKSAPKEVIETQLSNDPKIAELQKRARENVQKARYLRASAPEGVRISGMTGIQLDQTLDRWGKLFGDNWHFMTGDRNLSEQYVDQGYEPVVIDGRWENNEGDPGWMIPKDVYEGRLSDLSKHAENKRKHIFAKQAENAKRSGVMPDYKATVSEVDASDPVDLGDDGGDS